MAQEVWDFFKRHTLITAVNNYPDGLPAKVQLLQNYPNPFNPSTTISYQLSVFSDVELSVYDVLG